MTIQPEKATDALIEIGSALDALRQRGLTVYAGIQSGWVVRPDMGDVPVTRTVGNGIPDPVVAPGEYVGISRLDEFKALGAMLVSGGFLGYDLRVLSADEDGLVVMEIDRRTADMPDPFKAMRMLFTEAGHSSSTPFLVPTGFLLGE